ncbi:hypothetical protein RIEGSTA812A_PEG_823 [invertebrate metagenome]|uniref:Uncharacterized protein n=1 Tax=invertebrate metagenome TaxID=1711999 RepID=A0A484H735_9ZZZZ
MLSSDGTDCPHNPEMRVTTPGVQRRKIISSACQVLESALVRLDRA